MPEKVDAARETQAALLSQTVSVPRVVSTVLAVPPVQEYGLKPGNEVVARETQAALLSQVESVPRLVTVPALVLPRQLR